MSILSIKAAKTAVRRWKMARQVVVLSQGVFDLFHFAHREYLMLAASMGHRLLLGVDSDRLVRARKGSGRPIQPWKVRTRNVEAAGIVDVVYSKPPLFTNRQLARLLKPNVLVISDDTGLSERDIRAICAWGIAVVMIPRDTSISTSLLVSKEHNPSIHRTLRDEAALRRPPPR